MINYTPHAIAIDGEFGRETFPASGQLARVSMIETIRDQCGPADAVCVSLKAGRVEGLPDLRHLESETGDICLVSRMVLDALVASGDRRAKYCYAPDSGPTAVRNAAGQIEAVTRLVCAPL